MPPIFLSPPDMGNLEREALLRAFDSGWVAPAGPEIAGFESDLANFLSWPGVVALSSGTAALHLSLLVAGVKPGDTVFVSSFTFAATANAVVYCGATPVFIDSDSTTWNMSAELLSDALDEAKAANNLPSAVVVVDLYGQCADYDRILPLCHDLGIPVVEDSAEALGASYYDRPAGTLADSGVFSFNGNKILSTGGGGVYVSSSLDDADRVRYLSTQARLPAIHYEHSEVGYNYRMSNLLAAIGRAQLSRLPAMIERRLAINSLYRNLLADLNECSFMPVAFGGGWNGWLSTIVFPSFEIRENIRRSLTASDIESRPLWKPMHLQTAFQHVRAHTNYVSERLFERGLCLPSGSSLQDAEVEKIVSAIRVGLRSR